MFKKGKVIRPLAFVRLTKKARERFENYFNVLHPKLVKKGCAKEISEDADEKKILKEDSFIFFGEIPNMPGHCILVGYTSGKVFIGYHDDDFEELSSEET